MEEQNDPQREYRQKGTADTLLEELSGELRREKFRRRYRKLLRSTIYACWSVAAVSVLIATLLLPVLKIYGTSMNPNLTEGDIVVSVKSPPLKRAMMSLRFTTTTGCWSSG